MQAPRLRLERLDDRHTPSVTPTQVFDALNQVNGSQQLLGFIAENPQYLTWQVYQATFTRPALLATVERTDAAVAVLGQFLTDLQANAAADPAQAVSLAPTITQVSAARFQALSVANVARFDLGYVNEALGISPNAPDPSPPVSPPVSPPPPAPDLTSDSGMSDAVPDINSGGFTTLADGVQIRDEQVGTGAAVEPGATVQVYYSGYLTDGTEFDSRRSPQQPATFSLDEVVPGFAAGLEGMQPGGIRDIVIPPDQGYGNNPPQGSGIPPNATLIFQVKLISVTNPA